MKIAIASDHAGYYYKSILSRFLTDAGHDIVDFGTYSEQPADYPDYVRPAAEAVARGEVDRGIVLGGSGNGEAIVANRLPGIRCTVCWSTESARLARAHNDANMLSVGERMISEEDLRKIIVTWLMTSFEGGRHARRIAKIDK